MVNGGALATMEMLLSGDCDTSFARILDLLRSFAGNEELAVDEATFQGELRGADRNRATAYLMRSQGMLDSDVDATLGLYLRQCSVQVTRVCAEISGRLGLHVFATDAEDSLRTRRAGHLHIVTVRSLWPPRRLRRPVGEHWARRPRPAGG